MGLELSVAKRVKFAACSHDLSHSVDILLST
jgi:hypothetical protein